MLARLRLGPAVLAVGVFLAVTMLCLSLSRSQLSTRTQELNQFSSTKPAVVFMDDLELVEIHAASGAVIQVGTAAPVPATAPMTLRPPVVVTTSRDGALLLGLGHGLNRLALDQQTTVAVDRFTINRERLQVTRQRVVLQGGAVTYDVGGIGRDVLEVRVGSMTVYPSQGKGRIEYEANADRGQVVCRNGRVYVHVAAVNGGRATLGDFSRAGFVGRTLSVTTRLTLADWMVLASPVATLGL